MDKNFYPSLSDFIQEIKYIRSFKSQSILEQSGNKSSVTKLEEMDTVVSPYTGKKVDMKKVVKDMEAAKYKIVTQSPLYRPYVHEFDPIIYTWVVPTMATDGVRLFVNPEFADSLSWMGKIFVLIHEIYHCILMHMERGRGFDNKTFNIAGDLEINTIIVDTTDDFDKEFVLKEIKGLYDEKYLNIPVEQIYHDIIKNMPPLPSEPPKIKIDPTKPPQSPPPGAGTPPPPSRPQKAEIELKPGAKVRIKSTGEIGKITAVNADGTFEVQPINENYYPKFINEGYKREDLIPILPKEFGGKSQGDAGNTEIEGEYEIEGQDKKDSKDKKDGEGGQGGKDEQRDKEGKEGDSSKTSGAGQGDKEIAKKIAKSTGTMETGQDSQTGLTDHQRGLAERMRNSDRGQAGGFFDAKFGEQIAKASGYDEEEMRAGEEGKAKWEANAREIQKTVQKMKQAGSGRGDALINKLGKLLKGTVDWRAQLKLFVGTALSPEKYFRIGAKKHLYKSSEYLKRGLKPKVDAIKRVIVAVDVSGSMFHGNTFERIIGEVNDIIFAKKIKEITVIFFDDGVDPGSVQVVKQGTKVWKPKNIKGGGGTDFQPPLDWIKENYNDAINLCIFLTDGYASNPKVPKYHKKFIWVIYDNYDWEAPFGRVIKTSVSDM